MLVISGLGMILFYCRGAETRVVRSREGPRFSQIEAGNGIKYERTLGHQDVDWFVAVRGLGEQIEEEDVPVTEL